jgi:hypothetical protein
MHKSEPNGARAGAIVLNVIGVVAIALMAARCMQLHGELAAAAQSLAETRSQTALAVSNRFALPPNRQLAVCNGGDTDATISAVTANFIDDKGKPATYNSASGEGHTWKIAARSRITLEDAEAGAPVWNGSAIFFALDVVSAGKSRLLAGTSEDLKSGCIQLVTRKSADRD